MCLNYRYKYFVKDNVNSPKAYNGDDFDKFHGRNLAYTKYWLDGRFHILDAYFNVSQYDDMLTNEIHAPYVTSQEYNMHLMLHHKNISQQIIQMFIFLMKYSQITL